MIAVSEPAKTPLSLAHGLAMRVQDGVSRKALNQAIAAAMASRDSLVALNFESGKN